VEKQHGPPRYVTLGWTGGRWTDAASDIGDEPSCVRDRILTEDSHRMRALAVISCGDLTLLVGASPGRQVKIAPRFSRS
jgi:hypothetical protein